MGAAIRRSTVIRLGRDFTTTFIDLGVHLVSMPLAASNSPIMVSGMSAVKPIVDLSRHRFRNAVDGFEVLEAGARTERADPKWASSAFLRLGPIPGTPSSGLVSSLFCLFARCVPIAQRCASSRSRCRKCMADDCGDRVKLSRSRM